MSSTSSTQVALLFAIGTAAMLFMATAIILFVAFYQKKMLLEQTRRQALEGEYQRRMLQAALESQENERNRVSKDLHDDIGMMLMTMRTQVNALIGKQFSQEVARTIRELVDETHETVRRLSWDLKPGTLERFGLLQTVREMCTRLTTAGSITIELFEEGESASLDKNQETLLFRIVQESVSNALRHAEASQIDIRFHWDQRFLTLTIEDNGVGFNFPEERSKMKVQLGLGLINIENRTTLLGGLLQFEKNVPSGTIVKIIIPIQNHG